VSRDFDAAPVDGGSDAAQACASTDPIVLASNNQAIAIAVDDSRVYWADYGALRGVAKAGGTPFDVASDNAGPWRVAVDDDSIYSSSWSGDLMRIPKSGGTGTIIAHGPGAGPVRPFGDYLYWLAFQNSEDARITRVHKDGTGFETLLTGRHFNDIAVDATGIYFVSTEGVGRLPLAGGDVADLAQDYQAWELAVDATNVYWYTLTSRIGKVPKEGGAMVTLVPYQEYRIQSLAVSESDVFWGANSDVLRTGDHGTIRRMPKSGGAVVTVATGQLEPVALALDATYVYWANSGWSGSSTGSIVKMCRTQ
jgi:hypothetical protein